MSSPVYLWGEAGVDDHVLEGEQDVGGVVRTSLALPAIMINRGCGSAICSDQKAPGLLVEAGHSLLFAGLPNIREGEGGEERVGRGAGGQGRRGGGGGGQGGGGQEGVG